MAPSPAEQRRMNTPENGPAQAKPAELRPRGSQGEGDGAASRDGGRFTRRCSAMAGW